MLKQALVLLILPMSAFTVTFRIGIANGYSQKVDAFEIGSWCRNFLEERRVHTQRSGAYVQKKIHYQKSCIFTKKAEMTFEKTYVVQKDNRLIINLPARFKSTKRVRVIIEDLEGDRIEKIKLLKEASKDPLFLSDVDEITSDFENSDSEI